MRKGQNPAKFVTHVARPERITVAVLSYIPFLSGFYAESLEVLKVCLDSARNEAGLPFDLLVFDNGSCAEVREYLLQEQAEGRIQYLFLSEKNLGKGGAWNIIFGGAPGEIIAYADSDVLFYPGWLKRSVEILEHFPNVGMVTARPFRTPPEFYSATLEWARTTPEATVEEGHILSYEWFYEFSKTLGYSDEELERIYQETKDIRLTYRGLSAFVGASHWQFTAYKSVLQQFLPFTMGKPMGQVRQLDQRMDEAGYLRLMPTERYAQNMSNRLPASLRPSDAQAVNPESWQKRVLNLRPIKAVMLKIYNTIFELYYD